MSGFPHAHLSDGRVVTWRVPPGPAPCAVDAELSTQPPPSALAARLALDHPPAFWAAWTRLEVYCKLLDVPVLVGLHRYGRSTALPPPGVHAVRVERHDGITLAWGIGRPGASAAHTRRECTRE
ncbi:hypothetical protein [Streptomyces niveiscabiei]|uniref:Uncharacterized protein n=1 Tax=Streptomyces niveiscabiei TaxID=164115 RepID=A0ABW9I749_9ACTN